MSAIFDFFKNLLFKFGMIVDRYIPVFPLLFFIGTGLIIFSIITLKKIIDFTNSDVLESKKDINKNANNFKQIFSFIMNVSLCSSTFFIFLPHLILWKKLLIVSAQFILQTIFFTLLQKTQYDFFNNHFTRGLSAFLLIGTIVMSYKNYTFPIDFVTRILMLLYVQIFTLSILKPIEKIKDNRVKNAIKGLLFLLNITAGILIGSYVYAYKCLILQKIAAIYYLTISSLYTFFNFLQFLNEIADSRLKKYAYNLAFVALILLFIKGYIQKIIDKEFIQYLLIFVQIINAAVLVISVVLQRADEEAFSAPKIGKEGSFKTDSTYLKKTTIFCGIVLFIITVLMHWSYKLF